jgi:hypothetical protein
MSITRREHAYEPIGMELQELARSVLAAQQHRHGSVLLLNVSQNL